MGESQRRWIRKWRRKNYECDCGTIMKNGSKFKHLMSERHLRFMNLEKTHEMIKAYPEHNLTLWRPKKKEMVLRFESPAVLYF